MEGGGRNVLLLIAVCVLIVGCGDSSSKPNAHAVLTATPGETFAPLVQLAADERWRPASARWLIENSVLWFASGDRCDNRKVAVGRTLPEQRSQEPMQGVDWIYPVGMGLGAYTYYRNLYDERCKLIPDNKIYADQLSRPHDEGLRPKNLPPGAGFHLDLVDEVRDGPNSFGKTPVYVERANIGDGEVRLTYWMLFSMNAPPGRPAETHEGDWERVEVLLRTDGPNRYEPRVIRLTDAAGKAREVPWRSLERSGGHPVLTSERGSHTMAPAAPNERCDECVRWRTWRTLADVRKQRWYGFGGAWGAAGKTSATTGPLGPHGEWRPDVAASDAADSG
jgi:hypothetical protein